MKQFITLMLLTCTTLMVAARPDDGMLSITNLSEYQIVVEVDGRQYTDCEANLIIRDLTPGFHTVRVYSNGVPQELGKRPMLFMRKMQVKARYMVDIVINRFNRVYVDEELTNGRWQPQRNDRYERPTNNNGRYSMNEQSFLSFKQTLGKESFDNSKMTIAKQVIDQNLFTSEQAKQLAQLFTFNDAKLEIAKYLYGRTIDKENYFIIYNVLTYARDKELLADYIKNYR